MRNLEEMALVVKGSQGSLDGIAQGLYESLFNVNPLQAGDPDRVLVEVVCILCRPGPYTWWQTIWAEILASLTSSCGIFEVHGAI